VLEVRDLHTYFGKSHILQGVSFEVREAEVVSFLGRNGAGKTTTLRSIMGISRSRTGSIEWNGRQLMPMKTHEITRLGIAYVPEDRRIFSDLTIEENLAIAAAPGRCDIGHVFGLFPPLEARRRVKGRSLSGGEQQMLAIGRALMTNPRLLLLDEPSQGLAPNIVESLVRNLLELKTHGMSILLVEQALEVAMRVADRDYIIEHGRVVYNGDVEGFTHNRQIREQYLGV
jgi:branched-chain amino acid transport system ATP-binding protein